MTERESAIWNEFLRQTGIKCRWIVEEAVIAPLTAQGVHNYGDIDYNFWHSCQLRADIMFSKGSELILVEVEEGVTTAAIGQLVSYSAIWNHVNPRLPIYETWLVALYDDERLHPALKATNIQLKLLNALPGTLDLRQARTTDRPPTAPGDPPTRTKTPGSEPPKAI